MNSSTPMGRRAFLRGTGALISLPWLESLAPKAAAAPNVAVPVRMAVLYMANGVNPHKWAPEGNEHNFKLSESMAPLEPLKQDILILQKLWNKASNSGDGHYVKTSGFLTGTEIVKTTGADLNSRGISVDQLIAQKIGGQTKLASLELGTEPITTGIDTNVNYTRIYGSHIAWKTPTTPLPCEINPRAAFDRLFRTRTAAQQREGAADRSVLDLVRDEAKSLRSKVGRADQQKLDEYLEGIRSVERRIDGDAKALNAGENVDPRIFDYIRSVEGKLDKLMPRQQQNDLGSMPRINPTDHVQIMLDLMVLGFWSNSTRICTFMFANAVSGRNFSFVPGVKGGHHEISHHKNDAEQLKMFHLINKWHVEQYAALLQRMKEIKEPNGKTLLDNSMVLFGAGMRDGNAHDPHDLPLILAGSAGGSIKPGRNLDMKELTPLSNLYVGMAGRMGVELKNFADSTGELRGLKG